MTDGADAAPPAPPPPPALARFYDQRSAWRACGEGFECAEVVVPLDYGRPEEGSVELAVVRLPAAGPQRVGSLLVNPGGPGGSGVDYARAAPAVLTPAVRQRFDVVGFDPRGVGRSDPVECLPDAELEKFLAADGSPDEAGEERTLLAQSRALAQGCARRSGRLLPRVGTEDAARDLDVLRGVLRDERLHYLGKSYGTYLGAVYAELFPQRVGRLVLDGALDPAADGSELLREQAQGFDLALGAFVTDCLATERCPLQGPPERAVEQVRRLLEATDAEPLPAGGRELPQALAVLALAGGLYDRVTGWPALRVGLGEALAGDGTALLRIADSYTGRQPDGSYRSNSNEAIYAVSCLDHPEGLGVGQLREQARRAGREAPVFGPHLAWGGLPCSVWPVRPADRPRPLRAAGAAPILVVGTTRDPATPVHWAAALADQLESGVLLVWDGDGHTAYSRGSRCVDEAVDAYLLRGELPPEDRRCG